jgi:anti-sigma factor RsiW
MNEKPDDEMLSAWLDSELEGAERQRVQAWLRDHADDAARVRLWQADREALRTRLDATLHEPVPQQLLDVVLQGSPAAQAPNAAANEPPRRAWLQAAMAAGLVAGGALLGAAGVWQVQRGGDAARLAAAGPAGALRPASQAPAWTDRAVAAHAVYVPEVRHPVEVSVQDGDAAQRRAQEEHLVKWLGKRLAIPVRLFDLSTLGYALVGGRLLPDDGSGQQPGAQLMYEDKAGTRITMYLRKPEPGTDTAFRYQQRGELGMYYWVEDGYGCAIVGKLPREKLLAVAEAAYKQYDEVGHTTTR